MHQLAQAPAWALALSTAAVIVTLAVLAYLATQKAGTALWRARARTRAARKRQERETGRAVRSPLADAGPLALLGACGMAVSLYGLWGFARDTADLPLLLRVAFCAIFDVAELTCFVGLYRAALDSKVWTRTMSRTRRMAWTLVGASAAMNAAHAPGGWISRVVLAAVPIVSARLVEHGLDQKLEANAGDEEAEARPGPLRLVQLAWLHGWARIFAGLGLDAGSVDGRVPQEARIRRAAALVYELGQALDTRDRLNGDPQAKRNDRRKAGEQAETLRARAQQAIDSAGVATDTAAALQMARYLVARGRVADLARMDVADPMRVLTLLEELAIVPSVEAIEAGARAALAEEKAAAAELRAEAAELARKEAEEAAEAAGQRMVAEAEAAELRARAAERARQKAEEARDCAVAEAAAAELRAKAAEDAEQAAERAGQAAEDARLAAERAALTLRDDVTATEEARQTAERQLREAEAARQAATEEASRRAEEADAAARAQHEAEQARQQAEQAAQQIADQARELQQEADRIEAKRRRQLAELDQLAAARQQAEAEAREAAARAAEEGRAARQAAEDRRAAQVALRDAQAQIRALLDGSAEPQGGEEWKSPDKARGWTFFRDRVRNTGEEPTAAEVHTAIGEAVHIGTVRSWMGDFRQRLAEEVVLPLHADRQAAEANPAHPASNPAQVRRLEAATPRAPHPDRRADDAAPQPRTA